jgi:hypothetical protein
MSTDPEVWITISEYPAYEVSDRGRVRRAVGGPGAIAGVVLRPCPDKDGYQKVRLYKAGKDRAFGVHVLVNTAFNGPPAKPSLQTRHWDGIKSNNTPKNLLWGTVSQNAADTKRLGKQPRGEISVLAKLTQQTVNTIREEYGISKIGRKRARHGWLGQTAAKLGISKSYLQQILAPIPKRW